MTKEQVAKITAACLKAKEAAIEIEQLADDLAVSDERHDARETARIIGDEADVSIEWMRRIKVST